MPERPIIIRGGLSESLLEESTTRSSGSTDTGISLFVESKDLLDRLEFIPNADHTRWQLRNVLTDELVVRKSGIQIFKKKLGDGKFEVELDRDPARKMRSSHPSEIKTVLLVAAVGFVAWLLSRRS